MSERPISITISDRTGRRIKLSLENISGMTVFDVKKLISEKVGVVPSKIRLQRAKEVLNDSVLIEDYEIAQHSMLELHYN